MIKGNEIGFMNENVFVKARFGLGKGLMKFGNDLMIEADGYLGELEEGRVVLNIKVYDSNIHGFTTQPGQKRVVVPKKDIEEDPDNLCKNYTLNIAVKDNYEGGFCTQYPSNSLGLLWVKDGVVEYWRIAVVEQNGKFFLICEKVYESALYLGSGDDKLHAFNLKMEQWDSIMSFIRSIVDKSVVITKLSRVPDCDRIDLMHGVNDGRGVVVWFSKAGGTGAMATNKGMARFYYGEIKTDTRFASLEKGQVVEYERLGLPNLISPSHTTDFKQEAFGIVAL